MRYLVAFATQRDPGNFGFSSRELILDEPILNLYQLNRLLLQKLQNEEGEEALPDGTSVTVLSFQRFED